MIRDHFTIDRYAHEVASQNLFLKHFMSGAAEEKKILLLNSIYEKWRAFYNALLADKNFILNEILLTDYQEAIAMYFSYVASEDDVINEMKEGCYRVSGISKRNG